MTTHDGSSPGRQRRREAATGQVHLQDRSTRRSQRTVGVGARGEPGLASRIRRAALTSELGLVVAQARRGEAPGLLIPPRRTGAEALTHLWEERLEPSESQMESWRERSTGAPLPAQHVAAWSEALGTPLSDLRVHQDSMADLYSTSQRAAAVTVGRDIYLGSQATPEVLAHEFVHVAQGVRGGPAASVWALEAEAAVATASLLAGDLAPVRLSAVPTLPLCHPAIRVLRGAGNWLARRTMSTVSRHIARHGHRIAGRAVHTVFRKPRNIRSLLQSTVREATSILARVSRHGADDVIEEGGYRIFRQATGTPGKFRWIVDRRFDRTIGTQGERVLRMVMDQTGRIVTAFPVDRLMTIGGGVAALNALTAQTAEAAELVHQRVMAEENRDDSTDILTAIIDFLVDPTPAGEGEQLMLDTDRIVAQTVTAVIREIEEADQLTLGPEQRGAIADMVRASIGAPMMGQSEEDD